jgi:hypothetical protein
MMKVVLLFAGLALVGSASSAQITFQNYTAATGTAAMMPPPVSMPVIVIAQDAEAQAGGEAFLTLLREHGWFANSAIGIEREALQSCVRQKTDQAACVRSAEGWKRPGRASVIVLASGTPVQNWTCIGIAAAAAAPDRQTIVVDLRDAMFGTPKQRLELRNRAAACIMGAGSESGW